MKTITIGRGPENMVTLDEPMTSRHHALLRCYPFGKMEIVDLSQNGTFVNGMRIANNKPYPLTRKDIVIFAHVEKLDWNRVPSPYRRIKHILLLIIALIALIIWGAYIFSKHNSHMSLKDAPPPTGSPIPERTPGDNIVDTIKKSEKKSDDRFVFPQPKKTNSKGKKKEDNNDVSKKQEQEAEIPSPKEDVQEQSVLL